MDKINFENLFYFVINTCNNNLQLQFFFQGVQLSSFMYKFEVLFLIKYKSRILHIGQSDS